MEGDRERLAAANAEIESLGRRLRDAEGQAELFRGTVSRRDAEIERLRSEHEAVQSEVERGWRYRNELEAEITRLRSAAARALERTQVCDDPSGGCDEATAILESVVNLDGTPVPHASSHRATVPRSS